jgi:hypothetical protein
MCQRLPVSWVVEELGAVGAETDRAFPVVELDVVSVGLVAAAVLVAVVAAAGVVEIVVVVVAAVVKVELEKKRMRRLKNPSFHWNERLRNNDLLPREPHLC